MAASCPAASSTAAGSVVTVSLILRWSPALWFGEVVCRLMAGGRAARQAGQRPAPDRSCAPGMAAVPGGQKADLTGP